MNAFIKKNAFAIITVCEVVADFAVILLSLYLAERFRFIVKGLTIRHLNIPILLSLSAIQLATFFAVGLYKKRSSLMNIHEMQLILKGSFMGLLIFMSITFFIRGFFLPRLYICLFSLCVVVLMLFERFLFFQLEQHFHTAGLGVSHVLIYPAGDLGKKIAKVMLQSPKFGYKPVGFLNGDVNPGHAAEDLLPTVGGVETAGQVIDSMGIDGVLIAGMDTPHKKTWKLIDECRKLGVKFWIIPDITRTAFRRSDIFDIAQMPAIGMADFRMGLPKRIAKRVFDIIISALLLFLLSPLFLITIILIKKNSPGPALFNQKRIGLNGRVFRLWKFRTMYATLPKYDYAPTGGNDSRVTRVGRFLRRTSLDELPQLWNVIRGDMSIVGPRPEMPFIVEHYDSNTRQRILVKPGITGLWQVSADRGVPIHENLEYDFYYMENHSFFMDMAIFLKTIISTVRGIGAF